MPLSQLVTYGARVLELGERVGAVDGITLKEAAIELRRSRQTSIAPVLLALAEMLELLAEMGEKLRAPKTGG